MKSEPYSNGFVAAYKKHNQIGIKKKKRRKGDKEEKGKLQIRSQNSLVFSFELFILCCGKAS